ncbi:hypothetical protein PSTG_14579 [Puccinia striiformis f. sp. tritici PST-78]|uniref:Uncharacterized protein n=1 Tax=Puccinia striiformis f. sp. tritici PST-78 TaxID=1165861 RepID=A0A0L0UYR4_9BASI|nr:hypothetical protein PSTG_14579 [Puccinia striiformis f. sp. tritici PST-78]
MCHQNIFRGEHIDHSSGVYGFGRIKLSPSSSIHKKKKSTATASKPRPSSHPAFVPRINLLLGPGSIVGTMNTSLFLIPFIIQYFATGMQPPPRELASLGQTSSIENRDGILDISSPPRMVELLPVDRVSIDIPPCKDVSAYDRMVHKHNSPYKVPSPWQRAMNTYPAGRDSRDDPIPPGVVITRNRDSDDGCFCLNRYFIGGLVGVGATIIAAKPQPPEVLVVAYCPTVKRVE